MSTTAATGEAHDRKAKTGRTLAQSFCLIFGVTLLAAGILGFVFGGSSFTSGNNVVGDELIVFEVNGWHNVVHIGSGVLLLIGAVNGPLAATIATAFGVVYGAVTVLGLVDGEDILNLLPINTADNILHIALTVTALVVGLASGGLMAAARRR